MKELSVNQIICGDCLDVMNDWPDNCVDLVLTDPPYGVGLDYDVYEDTEENWRKMFLSLIPNAKRVAGMTIMPSCQIKKMPFIYANHPPDWLICWYKGSVGTAAYVGFNDWEPLLVYGKNKGVCMHDFLHCTPRSFDNGHPCPKPIEWAEWLISRTTKAGDLILDPFCGSGTTCVAAKMLGRNYIGIDISEEYCQISRERIGAAEKGVSLKDFRGKRKTLFDLRINKKRKTKSID